MCGEDARECEQENAFSGRENAFSGRENALSSSQLGVDEVVGGEWRGEEDARACGGVREWELLFSVRRFGLERFLWEFPGLSYRVSEFDRAASRRGL